MKELIQEGAEAKIFLDGDIILKDRIPKLYRHPNLDEKIRLRRTRSEAKVLGKAFEAGAGVPKVLKIKKFQLWIEFIDGDKLSENLNSYNEEKQSLVMKKLGEQTFLLHKNDLIHGDLTTSNVILKGNRIFIIDFGLGFVSKKMEDRAVDLHLIKQALEAKHFQNHKKLFEHFIKGYLKNDDSTDARKILERLEVVEKRGRYKQTKKSKDWKID